MNIDILMATYNGEKYIENQILSLQQQTHKNWILYIRDDGSTDLQNKLYKNEIAVYEDIEIDIIRFSNIYFDIENNYLKEYDLIKFRWLGLKYFKYDFFGAFISTIKILINHRKLIIGKIVKKLKLVK